MGNEYHSDAPGRHAADGIQQRSRLALGQDRRGFVEDQELQLFLAELARDLGKLLVTDGHVVDDHLAVDLHAHLLDGIAGALSHGGAIQRVQPLAEHLGDHALFLGFTVQQDVFRGAEAGNQGKLLVHHADAGRERIKGRGKVHLLPVQEHVAAVSAGIADHIHAKQDLHQRALARAVFADQAEHLALVQGQVDVGQDLVAEEVLFDVAHFQKGRVCSWHIYDLP